MTYTAPEVERHYPEKMGEELRQLLACRWGDFVMLYKT